MALLLAHSAARPTAPEISLHSGAASVVLAESAPSATERILRSSRSLPKQLWPGRKAGDNKRAPLQKRVVVEARAHGGAGCAWRDHRQPRPAGRHLVVHVQVAPHASWTCRRSRITCAYRRRRPASTSSGRRYPPQGSGGFCLSGKASEARRSAPWATTSVRESYGRALCITNRAKPSGPRPYKTRRFSMCAY